MKQFNSTKQTDSPDAYGFAKVDSTEIVFWPGAELVAAAEMASARHPLRTDLIHNPSWGLAAEVGMAFRS